MFLLQEGTAGNEFLRSIILFLPVILIFWFLIISPQRKQEKRKRELLSSLKKGDKVITISGLLATVKKVYEDNIVLLELSEGVEVKILKGSIEALQDTSLKNKEKEKDEGKLKKS